MTQWSLTTKFNIRRSSKNCPATQGMMTYLTFNATAAAPMDFEELPRNAGDDDWFWW